MVDGQTSSAVALTETDAGAHGALERELTAEFSPETLRTQAPTQTIRHHPETAPDSPLPRARVVWEGEGDYQLQRLVGRGGTGVIQLASQRALGRSVALKRLAQPKNERAVRAILREVRIAGRLQHPGIVPMYGVFEDPELGPIVAMPYIAGNTWRSAIPTGAISTPEQVPAHVRIAIELSNALEYAHARGVLHLDVKPENVMLGDYGEVFLLDWGVACDPEFEQRRARVLGTPAYMAPEMVRPKAAVVDRRSDVYLLGASLYEALYGCPPHMASTPLEAMMLALEPTHFPESELPEELASICACALSVDPAARYSTMGAFRAALERFLLHQDSERLTREAAAKLERYLSPEHSHPDPSERVLSFEPLEVDLNAALALWPENPRALSTLQALRKALAEAHIDCGDLRAAHRVARDLIEGPTLLTKVAALESKRAAQARAHDEAHRVARDRAFKVDERHWKRATLVLGSFFALQGIATFAIHPTTTPAQPAVLIALAAVAATVWLIAVGVWRRSFFLSYANTAATYAVTTAFVLVLVNRILSALAGVDPVTIVRTDMLLVGGAFAGKVTLHRGFLGVVVFCLAGATLSAVWPESTRVAMRVLPVVVAVWLYAMWAHLTVVHAKN